mgnify:CR=1 FL=1|jgi:hypothetical protein
MKTLKTICEQDEARDRRWETAMHSIAVKLKKPWDIVSSKELIIGRPDMRFTLPVSCWVGDADEHATGESVRLFGIRQTINSQRPILVSLTTSAVTDFIPMNKINMASKIFNDILIDYGFDNDHNKQIWFHKDPDKLVQRLLNQNDTDMIVSMF